MLLLLLGELHEVVPVWRELAAARGPTHHAAQMPPPSYHQQGEHGLPHVEAVPPVVVGDPAVALTQGIHEPHQNLRTHAHQ